MTCTYQVSFDVFVFGLVVMNALNRPYRETSEVMSNLRKDGIIFFLVRTISSRPCHILIPYISLKISVHPGCVIFGLCVRSSILNKVVRDPDF